MTHQEYYIHLFLETLSEKEYKEEQEHLRYILGAHPKPQRSKEAQEFVDFVRQNIYAGNTAFDILKRHFKIDTENATYEFWMQKTGLSEQELQCKIDASQRLAKYLIKKAYERFDSKLNELRG